MQIIVLLQGCPTSSLKSTASSLSGRFLAGPPPARNRVMRLCSLRSGIRPCIGSRPHKAISVKRRVFESTDSIDNWDKLSVEEIEAWDNSGPSTPRLDTVNFPVHMKNFNSEQLRQLCKELRADIVNKVSKTGGHLSSSLGVVELTVAMHYVFNSPEDKFIWDVGHQAYGHKILTGRRSRMHTIRTTGGLSGAYERVSMLMRCSTLGCAKPMLHCRLHKARGIRVRSLRCRPQLHFHLSWPGHGCRPRLQGQEEPCAGRDRRWRHHRRHGVRGHEPCRVPRQEHDRHPER